MPDLMLLPNIMRVFVDTNIFDLHYRGKSASCTAFIERIAQGEITAYVNIHVLSDLLHKLMLAEAYAKGLIASRSAQKLKTCFARDRTLATTLADYQTHFENTLAIGLNVFNINQRLLITTKMERMSYGLLTGDSLHLGTMNREKVPLKDIATHDGDFSHISGLTVWTPMDVIT
jgi:predicted nucleic acid-binding protein